MSTESGGSTWPRTQRFLAIHFLSLVSFAGVVLEAQSPSALKPDFEAFFEEDLPVSSIGAVRGAFFDLDSNRDAEESGTSRLIDERAPWVLLPEKFSGRLCALVTSKEGAYRGQGPYRNVSGGTEARWQELSLPVPTNPALSKRWQAKKPEYSPKELAVRIFATKSKDDSCDGPITLPSADSSSPDWPVLLPVVWWESGSVPHREFLSDKNPVILVNGVLAGRTELRFADPAVATAVCKEISGPDFNRFSHECGIRRLDANRKFARMNLRFRAGRRVKTSPRMRIQLSLSPD